MADKTDWDGQMDSENDDADDFIELTDIVKDDSNKDASAEEPVLEVSQYVEPGIEDDALFSNPEIDLDDLALDDFTLDDSGDDESEEEEDFEKEIDFEQPDEIQEVSVQNDTPPSIDGISSEQIEAALEKVIEKKFAEKIDSILFEVMEKVIEKEILDIKESLQKDLDDIGKV